MRKTIPNTVAMVRPKNFGFNPETAANNAFQNNIENLSAEEIQQAALDEFNTMVDLLESNGIEVIVFNDNDLDTPDSIFPNNWFSTFTKDILLYPMYTPNRRKERKPEIYKALNKTLNKNIDDSLVNLEQSNEIVEGTGSLVCDYTTKTAFAALSPRTTRTALDHFEKTSGYSTVRFESYGPDDNLIYHTNVMLTMGDTFAVVGLDTIKEEQRDSVKNALTSRDKEIIALTNDQVYNHFAGNMLQLQNKEGDKFLVMSEKARLSLNDQQIQLITKKHNNTILSPKITVIETIGGGSARCMMAEIFY